MLQIGSFVAVWRLLYSSPDINIFTFAISMEQDSRFNILLNLQGILENSCNSCNALSVKNKHQLQLHIGQRVMP